LLRAEDEEGMLMAWSGLAKRWEICEAVWLVGLRARFLRGRLERGSAEVGIDSGMGSDIVRVRGLVNGRFGGKMRLL